MASKGYILADDNGDAIGALATPMGEVHINANAVATVITTTQTYTLVDLAAWALGEAVQFDMPAQGRLRYTGTGTKMFHLGCTITVASAGASDVVRCVLYKNGTVNASKEFTGGTQLSDGIIALKLASGGDISSTAIHVMTTLATNDYIELGIANWTDADDLTVSFSNLFAMGTVKPA